jgi:hypothetical protein
MFASVYSSLKKKKKKEEERTVINRFFNRFGFNDILNLFINYLETIKRNRSGTVNAEVGFKRLNYTESERTKENKIMF